MRVVLPLLVILALTAPALALDPMLADGDWECELGSETLGGINVDGESYRYTRPDGRKRAGDLALHLDGVTYDIESGVLREEFGLNRIEYGDAADGPRLTLSPGDFAQPTAVGTCFRPTP